MKITRLFIALFGATLLAVAPPASAALSVADMGAFTVTYDDSSLFGGIDFSFSSGPLVGFGWGIPTGVAVSNPGSGTSTATFGLPEFTVTANPGYVLSGEIGGFIGNLVYTNVGSATTSAMVSGKASIDGSPLVPMGGTLGATPTLTIPGILETGYLSLGGGFSYGDFTTFTFLDGTLLLSASGGVAAITGQPQNELKVYFTATPVPEPETYAMMLAGLGLVGLMVRRRRG